MKYIGMPLGMWLLYRKSFREHLVSVLGCTAREAKEIAEKANPKYREIIEKLPDFEKGDRFQMNIVNCALLCAFLLLAFFGTAPDYDFSALWLSVCALAGCIAALVRWKKK